MYVGGWRAEAQRVIAKVDESLPADATLDDRKGALRRAAFDYHGGTSWGRRVWGQERRSYLARFGDRPKSLTRIEQLAAGGEITFPFRGQP